ncbi:unnamed protein product, partial [Protopolystoma xenopodis]
MQHQGQTSSPSPTHYSPAALAAAAAAAIALANSSASGSQTSNTSNGHSSVPEGTNRDSLAFLSLASHPCSGHDNTEKSISPSALFCRPSSAAPEQYSDHGIATNIPMCRKLSASCLFSSAANNPSSRSVLSSAGLASMLTAAAAASAGGGQSFQCIHQQPVDSRSGPLHAFLAGVAGHSHQMTHFTEAAAAAAAAATSSSTSHRPASPFTSSSNHQHSSASNRSSTVSPACAPALANVLSVSSKAGLQVGLLQTQVSPLGICHRHQ